MTYVEAQLLKPGDRVRFSDGVEGTVVQQLVHGFIVDWDDGQTNCPIAFEDAREITKVELQ